MSDGTLCCIAMLTSVLASEPNSMIVIEEIDNGIHPGRVQTLINALASIGVERCFREKRNFNHATCYNYRNWKSYCI